MQKRLAYSSILMLCTLTFLSLMSYQIQAKNICQKYNMNHGLFSIKTDGSELTLLRNTSGKLNFDKLRVSPNGKKIVYLNCTKDENSDCICDGSEYFSKEVVISNIDGTNKQVISINKGGFNDYPSWSPDGQSVIFMHSTKKNKLNTDLMKYDLKLNTLTNITNTPTIFESDYDLDSLNQMTLLQQNIKGHKLEPINNLFQFSVSNPLKRKQLSFATKNLGSHCCFADPRISPNMKYLSYAQYSENNGINGDWDIILQTLKGNNNIRQDLSKNSAMDLWPAWNYNSSKIAWTSWDDKQNTYSIRIYNIHKKVESRIKLIGTKISFKLGSKKLIFGRVHWFDWLHSKSDTLIFPATYASF